MNPYDALDAPRGDPPERPLKPWIVFADFLIPASVIVEAADETDAQEAAHDPLMALQRAMNARLVDHRVEDWHYADVTPLDANPNAE